MYIIATCDRISSLTDPLFLLTSNKDNKIIALKDIIKYKKEDYSFETKEDAEYIADKWNDSKFVISEISETDLNILINFFEINNRLSK